jgi:hypothetical protein
MMDHVGVIHTDTDTDTDAIHQLDIPLRHIIFNLGDQISTFGNALACIEHHNTSNVYLTVL